MIFLKIWRVNAYIKDKCNNWTLRGENWQCCLKILNRFCVLSLEFGGKSKKLVEVPILECMPHTRSHIESDFWQMCQCFSLFNSASLLGCLQKLHFCGFLVCTQISLWINLASSHMLLKSIQAKAFNHCWINFCDCWCN